MLNLIKFHLKKNKILLKDNLTLFLIMFFAYIINYVFHFYVGRTLGPEDYGIFGVLLSIIYIIVMPLMAIQTTLSRYVTELNIKNEREKLSYLFSRSLKKIGIFGLIISIIFVATSPLLSSFLKINLVTPLIILGASIIFAFLIPVIRGFLQGIQNFKLLGLTFIVESFSKIFFGIPLVFLGYGINGAVAGFALSFFLPLIVLSYFIKNIFKGKKKIFKTSEIYRYSFPVLIMLMALTGLYTWDIILIKRFFNPVEAGQYAALSLFGKVIFFATLSISMVMFPKILELNSQNKRPSLLLFKSILITIFLGFFVSLIYFLIPEFIVKMLFGKEYLSISPLLWIFGLIMTIFSICYLLSYYNIAFYKVKFLYLLIFFNILEILLLIFFHNSINQVLVMLLTVMILLFLSLIAYTLKNDRHINYRSGTQ